MPTHARRRVGSSVGATVLAIAVLALVAAPHASAATSCTKFAAPSGSDTAAGTEAAPFRSAQKLVNSLYAGDVGCLRAGTYAQGTLSFPRAGTASAPITLTSYPGELATLSGVVYVRNGSNNVTLSHLSIDGAADRSQITVQVMAADTVLAGNDITNRSYAGSCMVLGSLSGYGQALRTVVQRNRFHECGNPADGNHDHALYVENSDGLRMVDNLIWNSAAWAVHFYPNAQNSYVAHNVMDRNGGGVIFAGESAGGEYSWSYASSNNVVEKNVISNSTQTYNIESWWGGPIGSGNVARSNCVFNGRQGNISTSDGGFTSTGNQVADPKYLDGAHHDYRLGIDSPCLQTVEYDTAAELDGSTTLPPNPTPPADTTPPTVQWVSPPSGSMVSGVLSQLTSSCTVSASDNVAVAQVAFAADGSALNTDVFAPFGCEWDTRMVADGTHTLVATAADAAGNSAAASTQVTVANGTTVNSAPTVTITSPGDGALVANSFGATADAKDDRAVTKVGFLLDSVAVSSDTTAPYTASISLKARKKLDRWHTVTAKAFDAAGLASTASARVYMSSSVTSTARAHTRHAVRMRHCKAAMRGLRRHPRRIATRTRRITQARKLEGRHPRHALVSARCR